MENIQVKKMSVTSFTCQKYLGTVTDYKLIAQQGDVAVKKTITILNSIDKIPEANVPLLFFIN